MEFKDYIELYKERKAETQFLDAAAYMNNHTMHTNYLIEYIHMKIPYVEFMNALENKKVEIHGIYPVHAENVFTEMGYKDIQIIDFKSNPQKKEYNFLRPYFFNATRNNEELILVAVTPGKDYVRQYGEMIRFFFHDNKKNADDFVSIFHYPKVYESIATWTSLDSKFVTKDDVVIIGYVNSIEDYFKSTFGIEKFNETQNDFLGSRRYKLNGKYVNFLGVKFSFWGNISAVLANKVCELGASEIIYCAKTGALTSTDDLYNRLFCACKYINMDCDIVLEEINDVPNYVLQKNIGMDSDFHVSIPTVMEEDFKQREAAINKGIKSLDNETAQIASIIKKYNANSTNIIKFSYLHFATDYLYGPNEKIKANAPNLTKGRSNFYAKKKDEILEKMSKIICDHII